MNSPSRVFLVGAGPGDPGLLTLRGASVLARADVVLYDGLSNPAILLHAAAAEKICVGKHGQSRIWRQDEINTEIIRQAKSGRRVVRLKGGDPAVFARTAEEIEALQAEQIPFEIVPGITAALAAGSYAGIPITHRRLASAVALVTGHEEPEKSSSIDWNAIAQFPGTVVVYMGVTTAGIWTSALMAGGKDPATPAAIVRRCSLSDQRVLHCRLDEVAAHLTPATKLRPPVIVILGPVTALSETMSWFDRRPLFGKTVLVTRPIEQADELSGPLQDLGAEVVHQPAIEIGPPEDGAAVDQAIDRLDQHDWIVFCSRNGVKHFMERLFARGFDSRKLAGLEIATVGRRTADALRPFGLNADLVPENHRAEALAEAIGPAARGRRFLIVRASRGRDVLAESLRARGAEITQVAAYSHRDVSLADPMTVRLMSEGRLDWITVTSSATAESLHRLFGEHLGKSKIASLSPVTTATLRGLGLDVHAEADPYTIESLVAAIVAGEEAATAHR